MHTEKWGAICRKSDIQDPIVYPAASHPPRRKKSKCEQLSIFRAFAFFLTPPKSGEVVDLPSRRSRHSFGGGRCPDVLFIGTEGFCCVHLVFAAIIL
jgi:hypothetical protein